VQATSQHTFTLVLLSSGTQCPLTQSVSTEQVEPLGSAQFPLPSQIPLAQGVPNTVGVHTPVAQVRQGPAQAESQQTPPTHWPLWHSSSPEQDCPCVRSLTHVPAGPQNVTPTTQSLSLLQPHCPPTHALPAAFPAQLTPHAPQLVAVDTLVQAPPQQAWP
jgi:hypothetical protein